MHAYNRKNYSRHFTYHWDTQQKLEVIYPTIYQQFSEGHFSVRRNEGKFNMLPPDQVIEQTINKDQKGAGGIIGNSTSTDTIQIWVLSSNTATFAGDLKNSLRLKTQKQTKRFKKEKALTKVRLCNVKKQ